MRPLAVAARHLASLRSTSVTGAWLSRISALYARLTSFTAHRFVRLANDKSTTNRTIVFADPPGSTNYIYADVPATTLNDEIMDVAFLKVVGAENFPGGIEELARIHRIDDGGANLGDHWKHKYVVDLDGMSYSGRFFSFLESDSAVLKATVYREFFSDWIQPWYVMPLAHVPMLSTLTSVSLVGCTTSRSHSHTQRSTMCTHSSPVRRNRPCTLQTRRFCTCRRRSVKPLTETGD